MSNTTTLPAGCARFWASLVIDALALAIAGELAIAAPPHRRPVIRPSPNVTTTTAPAADADIKAQVATPDASRPTALANGDFTGPMSDGLPNGWVYSGSAKPTFSYDASVTHGGKQSLQAVGNPTRGGYAGSILELLSAKDFAGKRVRFSAWIKTENAGRVGLWILAGTQTAMVQTRASDVPFTDFQQEGTADWRLHEQIFDVEPTATHVNLGFDLPDSGTAWYSEAKLEVVADTVPLTAPGIPGRLRATNLNFESDATKSGVPGNWAVPTNAAVQATVDKAVRHGGQQSGKITVAAGGVPAGWAMSQTIAAKPLAGKTVTFSVWMKSQDLAAPAGPYIEASKNKGQYAGLGRENLVKDDAATVERGVTRTAEWKKVEVKLEVPKDALYLEIGIRPTGAGTVWVDDGELTVSK